MTFFFLLVSAGGGSLFVQDDSSHLSREGNSRCLSVRFKYSGSYGRVLEYLDIPLASTLPEPSAGGFEV